MEVFSYHVNVHVVDTKVLDDYMKKIIQYLVKVFVCYLDC